jgi:hypothetical protein
MAARRLFHIRYGKAAPPIEENVIQGARECEIYILHSYFHGEDPQLKLCDPHAEIPKGIKEFVSSLGYHLKPHPNPFDWPQKRPPLETGRRFFLPLQVEGKLIEM